MTTTCLRIAFTIILLPALLTSQPQEQEAGPLRVYSHLLNPREHPDDNRRHVHPPTWETFGNRARFMTLRGFEVEDEQLIGYREEIEKYTRQYELGDIIWPSYPILFAKNLDELLLEIKQRDLFLFDIWGYVPGSGPGGYWQQFEPPPDVFNQLEHTLGDRWLGMDVGEQDGRYIGGYASQMYPVSAPRFDQYLNFHRHFERFTADLGNKMATLVSLNFGHYYLKEGIYTLIGAETAQALPNSQVYYAFIRGAGKQNGVPWFGNASVYNRWGWKSYTSTGDDHGPTKGTSLSLMKRLLYSHLLYNSMMVGFESGWFEGDGLSPLGRIQQSARRWTREHGQPGVMVTPVAVMVDFFSGWSFPRHLYSRDVYRVWGNLPYEAGDYLTDGVLDMLYPGYQDSSYFHDESGFLSPTPYGDIADALMTDAAGWLLDRYPVLVIAGTLRGGAEIRDKLQGYVERGGHLVITAGNIARLPGGIADVQVSGGPFDEKPSTEKYPFEMYKLSLPPGATALAQIAGRPLVARANSGQGVVTAFASSFGIAKDKATGGPVVSENDRPLAKPYPLLNHVREALDGIFRSQMPFAVDEGLSLITCRQGPGEYTVGIANNGWSERPLRITSRFGEITSVRELELDQSEKGATGYLPEGMESTNLGRSSEGRIAGGDVRVFAVSLGNERVVEIPHVTLPPRPQHRYLHLRRASSIQREILARPTFFQHFDGVVIDWRYLYQRDETAVRREAPWLKLQGLRIAVDLTSGLNLYPDLRIIDNVVSDYTASMEAVDGVLAKMEILDARDLILSLHRFPENNFTEEQTWDAFERALRRIGDRARQSRVEVHLRMAAGKPPRTLREAKALLDRLEMPNLHLSPSTALLLAESDGRAPPTELLKQHIGSWLVSAVERDIGGKVWNWHAPIAGGEWERPLANILAASPETLVILDAVYKNHDQEYLDAAALDRIMPVE
jgi:hypothetical protein